MENNLSKDHSPGEVDGVVKESLPNTMFRVEIPGPKVVLAYLGGKMKVNRIKVLIGDKVKIKLDPYGERGRVIRRY